MVMRTLENEIQRRLNMKKLLPTTLYKIVFELKKLRNK